MKSFLGEFICAIDNKNRLRVPAGLLKQLQPADQGKFIINRGFEKCLVLYTIAEWEKVFTRVNQLNTFKKESRAFKRSFLRGASELILDTTERIVVPKQLMEYATISNEVIISANGNVFELWNPEVYNSLINEDTEKFADLAERVMGDDEIEEV